MQILVAAINQRSKPSYQYGEHECKSGDYEEQRITIEEEDSNRKNEEERHKERNEGDVIDKNLQQGKSVRMMTIESSKSNEVEVLGVINKRNILPRSE